MFFRLYTGRETLRTDFKTRSSRKGKVHRSSNTTATVDMTAKCSLTDYFPAALPLVQPHLGG